MDAGIRLATEDDAGQMLEIYGPVVRDTIISFEEQPPSTEEFRRRIRTVLERLPWLVCDIDGHIAGYAYATPFRTRAGYRWSAELTVYVHPSHHRRGVVAPYTPRCCAAWQARGTAPPWRSSPSRTPPASPCTSRWGSIVPEFLKISASSTAGGLTTTSGNWILGRVSKLRPNPSPWTTSWARLDGTMPWKAERRCFEAEAAPPSRCV